MKKNRNMKKNKLISLIIMTIAFVVLMLVLKLVNQLVNGTNEWLLTIKETNLIKESYLNDNWFLGGKALKNFFLGPMGFHSFLQFKFLGITGESFNTFLLPIFLDLLINWVILIGLIIFIILFLVILFKKHKIGNTKNLKVVKESKTGQDLMWKNKTGMKLTKQEALKATKEDLNDLGLQKVKGKKTTYIRSKPDSSKKNNLDSK